MGKCATVVKPWPASFPSLKTTLPARAELPVVTSWDLPEEGCTKPPKPTVTLASLSLPTRKKLQARSNYGEPRKFGGHDMGEEEKVPTPATAKTRDRGQTRMYYVDNHTDHSPVVIIRVLASPNLPGSSWRPLGDIHSRENAATQDFWHLPDAGRFRAAFLSRHFPQCGAEWWWQLAEYQAVAAHGQCSEFC